MNDKILLPKGIYRRRLLRSLSFGASIVLVWLLLGILGYHLIAGFTWIDSFIEASMILSGMGPVGMLNSTGSKIFAGIYAILSGIGLLSLVSFIMAPIAHRFLHHFHMQEDK